MAALVMAVGPVIERICPIFITLATGGVVVGGVVFVAGGVAGAGAAQPTNKDTIRRTDNTHKINVFIETSFDYI